MPRRALSVAEAKSKLSDAIREVEGGATVLITRHGKPVAALVRPSDLTTIERLRAAQGGGGLASLAGGWEGSEEFLDAVAASPRRGSRSVPELE
jgi:prevent-host-death family protein